MNLKAGSVFSSTLSTALYSIACLLIAGFLICAQGFMVDFLLFRRLSDVGLNLVVEVKWGMKTVGS
jgi:hypothetical protein